MRTSTIGPALMLTLVLASCPAPKQSPSSLENTRQATSRARATPSPESSVAPVCARAAKDSGQDWPRGAARSANLTIRTASPEKALHRVTKRARQQGAMVVKARQSRSYAGLTLRVPPQRLEQAVCDLAQLGGVERLRITTNDVQGALDAVATRLRHLQRIYRGLGQAQPSSPPEQAQGQQPGAQNSPTDAAQRARRAEQAFASWVLSQIRAAERQKDLLEARIEHATIHIKLREE